MNKILFSVALLVLAGGAYYIYYRRRQSMKDWYLTKTEVLDGTLEFSSIVSFFKTLNLDKNSDIPFLGREGGKEFSRFFGKKPFPEHRDGYQAIFIGVFDEKINDISEFKVIYAKELDLQTNQVFGCEYLVVLN